MEFRNLKIAIHLEKLREKNFIYTLSISVKFNWKIFWKLVSLICCSAKNFGRSPSRKQNHSSKSENCGEETFEDLLLKYKQIQLELECINKDEKLALSSKDEHVQDDPKALHSEDQTSTDNASITEDASREVAPEEKAQVKTFQAFELKPLRQKLILPGDKNRVKRVKDGTKQLSVKSSSTDASQGNSVGIEVAMLCALC